MLPLRSCEKPGLHINFKRAGSRNSVGKIRSANIPLQFQGAEGVMEGAETGVLGALEHSQHLSEAADFVS